MQKVVNSKNIVLLFLVTDLRNDIRSILIPMLSPASYVYLVIAIMEYYSELIGNTIVLPHCMTCLMDNPKLQRHFYCRTFVDLCYQWAFRKPLGNGHTERKILS